MTDNLKRGNMRSIEQIIEEQVHKCRKRCLGKIRKRGQRPEIRGQFQKLKNFGMFQFHP